MTKKNKTCTVCGERYFYCYDCNIADPAWKNMFHDENCKTIFETINKFYFKHISDEEAKNILQQCDLSVLLLDTANAKIKSIVDKIISEKTEPLNKKQRRQSKSKETDIATEPTDSTAITET